jgi:hypothetical protein
MELMTLREVCEDMKRKSTGHEVYAERYIKRLFSEKYGRDIFYAEIDGLLAN